MKRIVVSAGMMAMSAVSLHALYAPELSRLETGKPWTVSASLRGFYDDNWATRPSWVTGKKDSFGFEVRPYIGLNFPMEQTFIGVSYLNSTRWFEARSQTHTDAWDFGHEGTLRLDHAFSPRHRLSVRDTFTYGQEPDTTGGPVATALRANQSYIHNAASVGYTGQFTERLGASLGYQNDIWDYLENSVGGYSAVLDRMEHRIPVDVRWQLNPELIGLLGYTFGLVNYTGNSTFLGFPSSSRDSRSHTVFVGGDYDATAQLHASARVGAQYSEYPNTASSAQWTPYVDASVSYAYAAGCHADLGFRHTMSATDMIASDGTRPTLDQETSTMYLNVDHAITKKVYASLLAQYQLSDFHAGGANGVSEQFLMLGLYLSYRVNQHLSFEGGYNFDLLNSDWRVGGVDYRSYNRNRVFLGVRGTF